MHYQLSICCINPALDIVNRRLLVAELVLLVDFSNLLLQALCFFFTDIRDGVIIRDFDRSAPLGTGIYKVGGNYAASLRANNIAHEKGYACEFYLDAKEKKYMDECGAANFFGIKNNTYVTPKSTSILPSITNSEDLCHILERHQSYP